MEKSKNTNMPIEDVKPTVYGSKKIGLILQETRSKKNKTVENIADELKIRRIYLEAIENSDYKNIPLPPYGVGFVKTYAEYLGLDGNDIATKFKAEINSDNLINHKTFAAEVQTEAEQPNKKYLIIALIAIIAIYGLWSVIAYNSEEATKEEVMVVEEKSDKLPIIVEEFVAQTTPENTSHTDSETLAPEAIVVEPIASTIPAITEPVVKDIRPVIKTTKEVWIEVKTPNKLYISKVLQPHEEYVLPNDNNLLLSVGKEDGIEFYIGNKLVPVASANKKTNISLDPIIAENN